MLLLSVISAAHSRDIASVVGYPSPEEAHLAGLFRNMGEVVIGCHYPQEYSAIILKMHAEKIDGRAACVRVLGFGWDDVGGGLAEAWNLPSNLVRCLRGSASAAGSTRDRSLSSITDYARELTHAIYRRGCGIESVHLRLCKRCGRTACAGFGSRSVRHCGPRAIGDGRVFLRPWKSPSSACAWNTRQSGRRRCWRRPGHSMPPASPHWNRPPRAPPANYGAANSI